MKLRTRLNLVVAGLAAGFIAVLIAWEVQAARITVKEETEAANMVASQVLAPVAQLPQGMAVVLPFLRRLGHVRGNDIELRSPTGELLYHSPPFTYKAGREAPQWFAHLLEPAPVRHVFELAGGGRLVVEGQLSRAQLEAWDHIVRLALLAAPLFVVAMGLAFNGMARLVRDSVQVERKARETEARLAERSELALIVEQRLEEERRLIAHELHDEFGQSVTAMRSCAQAIAEQSAEPAMRDAARLIRDEAGRLYDAMHGLIPRLLPVLLDDLDLAGTLETLVRDWQRRYPGVELSLRHRLQAGLGPSVTLAAYRVVQEGLINALRHARAARIDISVEVVPERMTVSVVDDGVGLPGDWMRPGHFGLRGLAGRVEQLGGTFSVANQAPHGVRVLARIPLAAAA